MTASRIVFLGPQRRDPTVLQTLRSIEGVDLGAPVAIVKNEPQLKIKTFARTTR